MENKLYPPESLIAFTWCPISGSPVMTKECSMCESLVSLNQEKEGSVNIPLPYILLKCRYPGERLVYILDNVEIVSCARLKYNPYVKVEECFKCNFFVRAGFNDNQEKLVFCSVPTSKKVAFVYKDFKAMSHGEEKK